MHRLHIADHLIKHGSKDALLPLGRRLVIKVTVKLILRDRFRVNHLVFHQLVLYFRVVPLGSLFVFFFFVQAVKSIGEYLPGDSLARHSRTDKHITVSSHFRLVQLHNLHNKILVKLKTALEQSLFDCNLQGVSVDFGFFNFREEIHEKIVEENDIFGEEFGQIHITNCLKHNLDFFEARLFSLNAASRVQNRFYCSHREIVVRLLGKLALHQIEHSGDLLGQLLILLETFRHKNNLANGVEVRSHHSHRSEKSLQIVGQFRTSCVSRIHSDEKTCARESLKLSFSNVDCRSRPSPNCVQNVLDHGRDD